MGHRFLPRLLASLAIGLWGLGTLAPAPAGAQPSPSEKARVAEMAGAIAELMSSLEQRAADYPAFLDQLDQGLVDIEQADAKVAELIEQLQMATRQMEDGSDFDTAIDDYKQQTTALIAEAEASNNQIIKAEVPNLQAVLDGLDSDDEARARTVIEARNLIRTLEENREAIAFFIKADNVQRAADLIRANVVDFSEVIDAGKTVASRLLDETSP
ncbi:hypothetical protein [Marinibacterium sp. SX1]|uniref:hypothetical protein n=1 Tax=Marinibacterium sp. SX1 TaxID=3388424 RepID=UPI003D175431